MYPDVAQSGMDPWHHYVLKGKAEGRDNGLHPNGSIFFAAGYLEMYPDAAKSGMDPWRHYVLKGKAEGRDNGWHPGNDQFFPEGYLEMYPDVAKSKVDPWRHYIQFGKKEKRNNAVIKELKFLTTPVKQRKNTFLLISRLSRDRGVAIWRIQFLKEFLEKNLAAGAFVEYQQDSLSPSFIKHIQECKCVIFSRPQNDEYFESIYKYCHNNNIKIFLDFDDLLLPNYAVFELGGVKSKQCRISPLNINDKITRIQQCMPMAMADGIICSTKKIATLLRDRLRVLTHVHPNLISSTIFNGIAGQLSHYGNGHESEYHRNSEYRLHLLVADGSNTHLYDLSTVILELTAFLKKHPDIQLTLLGLHIENSKFLKKTLGGQLQLIPRVSYFEMLHIYSINDILVVPLDLNIFNECKSNIKFIEAAIVKKPCLVRDIYEFSKDITDRKTGLLYKDSYDFIRKLEWINANSDLLPVLGDAAYQYVSQKLTTDSIDLTDINFFANLLKE
jgi:glycosyltransferase involved in cell wall biosynthesis